MVITFNHHYYVAINTCYYLNRERIKVSDLYNNARAHFPLCK